MLNGTEIKIELLKIGKSQIWLLDQLRERGIICDPSELSKMLGRPQYDYPKRDRVFKVSTEIIKEYKENEADI